MSDTANAGRAWSDVPGRTVLDGLSSNDLSTLSFSADGRFLAVESFGTPSLRVVDLESGTELDPAAPDDCTVQGTKWSRSPGLWVGGTSLALVVTCPDETQLVIHDVATVSSRPVWFPEVPPRRSR